MMRPIRTLCLTLLPLALVAIGVAGAVRAHDMSGHGMPGHGMPGHDMPGHDMPGRHGTAPAATDSPATKAFRDVDAKMHRDMDIRYTNDVDADFVRGMIPHHEGAVAMAKVALQYSKDPEIRKLADEIVKAQDVEIAQMRAFQKRRGGQ